MSYPEGWEMRVRSIDLVGSGVLACAALAVAFAPGVPTVVRVVVGLPLVLVLPGYALTAALAPGVVRRGADAVVLSLGASISVAVLGGLVLNFTPWGLERRSWTVLLAAVTVVAAAGAALRRAGSPSGARGRLQPAALVLFALAVLVAVAAVGISRRGAIEANERSTFTQFSLLPSSGTGLRLGVINREGATQRYRIVVRAGGRQLARFGAIRLAAGASWQRTFHVPAGLPSRTRVQADLYRASSPGSVYRHVTFWTP